MTQDRIEKQIEIAATAEKVWELVSRPGWWINEGVIIEELPERAGDVDIVRHPKLGEFPIRTVKLDAPRYAAFRWEPVTDQEEGKESTTLTEFWIEDQPDSGVILRVVESGFASLNVSDEKRRAALDNNTAGWAVELEAARDFVEKL